MFFPFSSLFSFSLHFFLSFCLASRGECSLADTPTLDCYGVCRLHNRVPCFCSGENECNVCCQDQTLATNSSICVPFSPVVWLPRGSFCIGGVCQEGQCKLTSPDLINRLFNLFTDISIDSLSKSEKHRVQFIELVISAR